MPSSVASSTRPHTDECGLQLEVIRCSWSGIARVWLDRDCLRLARTQGSAVTACGRINRAFSANGQLLDSVVYPESARNLAHRRARPLLGRNAAGALKSVANLVDGGPELHFQWKPPAAIAIGDFQVDCLSIFAGKQRSDRPERVEPHICPEVPLSQWSELAMLTA